ncbi:zf-HC2 domain-containing protein [Dyella flava]|uniref:Zf-HC2 domain-containing protein n=1 Tax=Dyella flava TaxID=1920170 RepID=A0ABS2K2S3_9GAMM|nr:zf-HC2 domain-containing protein [Dyella flava]MBM7124960.1 zf-HC2 domain-containing protein [Dyella flava]GLQ49914.1 hypothetical protein GCM10010872_13630 [Dyella flava]
MNGRIIKFEGSVHAEADRLLPWYVNGTLDEGERVQVEQHLAECAACRREVEWLRTLQEGFVEQTQQDELSPAAHPPRHAAMRRSASPVRRRRERWLIGLAAIQAVVILALSVFTFRAQLAPYRTLSAPGDNDALLVVTFDPRTPESQLRQLVRAYDAHFVGGPTEGGVYILRVPNGRAAAMRKALHGSRQVMLVEDLGSGGNP